MNQEERDTLIAALRELSFAVASTRPDSCAPFPAENEIRELERLFLLRDAGGDDV